MIDNVDQRPWGNALGRNDVRAVHPDVAILQPRCPARRNLNFRDDLLLGEFWAASRLGHAAILNGPANWRRVAERRALLTLLWPAISFRTARPQDRRGA